MEVVSVNSVVSSIPVNNSTDFFSLITASLT